MIYLAIASALVGAFLLGFLTAALMVASKREPTFLDAAQDLYAEVYPFPRRTPARLP
jgi:hypothetical protein